MAKTKNNRKTWSPYETVSLWVGCGGRCTLCGRDLLHSHLTGDPGIYGEFAHIEAHSPNGPRGNGKKPYDEIESIDDIIVLCRVCHPNIDKYPEKYPTKLLQERKKSWEAEVRSKVYMADNRSRQVIVFTAPIAGKLIDVTEKEIRNALFDVNLFPGENQALHINLQEADTENGKDYWTNADKKLIRFFNQRISLEDNTDGYAIFGIAPIPLLIRFGTLLSDLPNCNVFNSYRDPERRWCWNDADRQFTSVDYSIHRPSEDKSPNTDKALVISMTSDISDRIKALNQFKIWEVKSSKHGYEALQSRQDLEAFRHTILTVLDEMSKEPGNIHIFMAGPNSAAIMLGMCLTPKINQDVITYDYIASTGQDVLAIKISNL